MGQNKNIHSELEQLKQQIAVAVRQAADNALAESMENYVKPMVKEVMSKHLNQEVYGVYTPKYYQRRLTNGGMADYRNMRVEYIQEDKNGGRLVIENIAPLEGKHTSDSQTALADLINDGVTNDADAPIYQRPRPFMDNTIEELNDGKLQQTLKEGFEVTWSAMLAEIFK